MKTKTIQIAAMLIISLLAIPNVNIAQAKEKATRIREKNIQLFNGKDLKTGCFTLRIQLLILQLYLQFRTELFILQEILLVICVQIEIYSDYKLHVEWRWPVEATNSGVFIHGQKPDTIWLKCIECQLKAGNAGDFVCMNGST